MTPDSPRPWKRRLLIAGLALAFVATTLVCAYAGYLRMFTSFGDWDDEGYFLISVRSFLRGEALYTDVYSLYGPFYFVAMRALFKALGLAVSHDSGRLVSLALWLAASLASGLLLRALTRNLWLACGIQLLAMKATLFNMAFESMHPGGLICLLLVLLAATPLLLPARARLALAFQGGLVAALVLIKINVGVLALIASGFSCVMTLPHLARRRILAGLAVLAFIATPVALLAPALGESWAQRYALHVTAAAVAVAVTVLSRGPEMRLGAVGIGWLVGGAATVGLLTCGSVLLGGTRPQSLLDAVLLQPLKHAQASSTFVLPLDLPRESWMIALLALAAFGAAAFVKRAKIREDRQFLIGGLFRLLAGGLNIFAVTGLFSEELLGFRAAPLLWVAALPPRGSNDSESLGLVRRFLPPLAILQTLHAYPVAGSQIQWGSYLLVPLAGICLADGARQLHAAATSERLSGWRVLRDRALLNRLGVRLGHAAALLLLVLTLGSVLFSLDEESALLRHRPPLPLPGSTRIHLDKADSDRLVWVAGELRKNCETFISLPGLNSFYFWAQQEPPTSLNASAWMFLLDTAGQERIVERLHPIDRLCYLRQEALAQGWQRGRPLPRGPVLDYLALGFAPVASRGGYEILARSPATP